MNYDIVANAEHLKVFYNVFREYICANVSHNRSHIVWHLQARKKYNPTPQQSRSTVMLARQHMCLESDAETFLRRVQSLEIKRGLYVDRAAQNTAEEAVAIANESLVLYATVNALDRVAATQKLVSNVVDKFLLSSPSDAQKFPFIDKDFITQLHNSPCTKVQFLDVDTCDQDFLIKLDAFLIDNGALVFLVTKTKNGYHYVIYRGPVMRFLTTFCAENAKDMHGNDQISMCNNGLLAVPGTFQGGVPVELLYAAGSSMYRQYASGRKPPCY